MMAHMDERRRGSGIERFLRSRMALGIGVALIVLLGVSTVREFLTRREVVSERERLAEQIATLEARKRDLSSLLQHFGGSLFQEQEAREKLGLAKPGESVVIVPETGGGRVLGSTTNTSEAPVSNPRKWLRFFFHSSG